MLPIARRISHCRYPRTIIGNAARSRRPYCWNLPSFWNIKFCVIFKLLIRLWRTLIAPLGLTRSTQTSTLVGVNRCVQTSNGIYHTIRVASRYLAADSYCKHRPFHTGHGLRPKYQLHMGPLGIRFVRHISLAWSYEPTTVERSL